MVDVVQDDATDNFLAHYGVAGMKWGVRSRVIDTARGNLETHAKAVRKAEKTYLKEADPGRKKGAFKDLQKTEKAAWENEQTAKTLKRGEQVALGIIAGLATTPIGGLAAVGVAGHLNRDSKKFKSKYPVALKGKAGA